MATAVVMPKQGQSVETCVITRWKKKPGDAVALGEILCEVETDKAAFEVESPAAGTLLAVFRSEGEDVPVLTAIAAVGSPGEETDSLKPGSSTVAAPESAGRAQAAPTTVAHAAPSSQVQPRTGKIAASPRAKALAAASGIGLAGIGGTGPVGRIIERDVRAAIAAGGAKAHAGRAVQASAWTPRPPAARSAAGYRDVPMTGVRRLIAQRMRESLQSTAQLTLNAWADAGALQERRAELKARGGAPGAIPTINDMIHFCVSRALASHPELNAHLGPGSIRVFDDVHLGFAVDTPRGLMVPVIKNAHALGLGALAAEATRLARGCKEGGISPDELAGGTFTVTNLGSLGIESFTPVLNPPQVGILGVGAIALRPRPAGAGFSFVPQISLSLTIDHQAADGASGARFLQTLGAIMADFTRIATE